MANTDNSCNHLEVDNKSYPEIDQLFQTQLDIQTKVYGYDFENMSLKELVDFWLMNKHAEDDETNEMFDALGGIHDGIGNAVWKPWKKAHSNTAGLSIKSLSERDRKELLMEVVDKLHFFMNFAVSVGFTGSEITNAYYAKNAENIERQKRGY